jgi:lipopolysaccharide/colanic/teichoic acid biosynthesis glycosyltransferase
VAALLALLVKMDSRGPILYSQSRVGRGGRVFQVWKFRSMVQNADDVLEAYLQSDPALRTEWEEYQKLYNDPRITRVGHFLRRTSLDELPQLWNIFVGQMSFIGPRPITEEQIELYGPAIELYKHVRPGLSGLWQVSGRNQTNFRRRAEYDAVYVRDWSIWLDLYLIGLTPFVVISGHGSN